MNQFQRHFYNTVVADTSFTLSKDEWQPIALQGSVGYGEK